MLDDVRISWMVEFWSPRLSSKPDYHHNEGMKSASRRCYCAFCKSERNVYRKRHVGAFDVALAMGAAILMSFIVWQDIDPRLAVFFVLAVGLAELFIVLRWRLSIMCSRCGFDPVLYRRSPAAAAAKVKEHYKVRSEDPMWLMSPPPKLPHIRKQKPEKKPGPSLSR